MQQDAIIRETSEWSNIWWDHADDPSMDRVLLIGDSISVGYTNPVIERLKGIALVDRLANSKGINDPALYKEITYMLSEYRYRAIHFNNGLHGWHVPDDVYASCLRQMVQVLRQYGQGAKLVWANSTPVADPDDKAVVNEEKNPLVVRRNEIAREIMQSYDIPINDLYQLVLGKAEFRSRDVFHFSPEGQVAQGEAVANAIIAVLSVES